MLYSQRHPHLWSDSKSKQTSLNTCVQNISVLRVQRNDNEITFISLSIYKYHIQVYINMHTYNYVFLYICIYNYILTIIINIYALYIYVRVICVCMYSPRVHIPLSLFVYVHIGGQPAWWRTRSNWPPRWRSGPVSGAWSSMGLAVGPIKGSSKNEKPFQINPTS